MSQKNITKKAAKTSSRSKSQSNGNVPARYRRAAQTLIDLLDSPDTPGAIKDDLEHLLAEYYENETQVHTETREVRRVHLPLMLQAIDESGLESQAHSEEATNEAMAIWEEKHGTEAIEKQADAIFEMLNSPLVPAKHRDTMGDCFNDMLMEFQVQPLEHPKVFRVCWTLIVQKAREQAARAIKSAESERKHEHTGE